VRAIQYNRTASLRATATLATPWCFLAYIRAKLWSPLAALAAPSTRRHRQNGLPCLLIAPSRRRCPLDSSEGFNPR